jgi:hypothetical protein
MWCFHNRKGKYVMIKCQYTNEPQRRQTMRLCLVGSVLHFLRKLGIF